MVHFYGFLPETNYNQANYGHALKILIFKSSWFTLKELYLKVLLKNENLSAQKSKRFFYFIYKWVSVKAYLCDRKKITKGI